MGGGAAPTSPPAAAVTRRLGPVCSRCSAPAEQDTYTRVSVCPELAFIRTAGFQQPTAPCATCEGQSLWSHGDIAAIFYLLRKSKRNELDYTPASTGISELAPDGHMVAGQFRVFSDSSHPVNPSPQCASHTHH